LFVSYGHGMLWSCVAATLFGAAHNAVL
jgi:hypothetical protein